MSNSPRASRRKSKRLSPSERKILAQRAAAIRWGNPIDEDERVDHHLSDLEPINAILVAAMETFAELGYEAATMAKIASRSGVGLPTVYRLYATKQKLYARACVELVGRQMRHHGAQLRRNSTVETKIYALALSMADTNLQPNLVRLAQWEMLSPHSILADLTNSDFWAQHFDEYFKVSEQLPSPRRRDQLILLLASLVGVAAMSRMRNGLTAIQPLATVEAIAIFCLTSQIPEVDWKDIRAAVDFRPFRLETDIGV